MDNNKLAVAIFDKFAQRYQDKYMDVSLYHDSLDLFCESVKPQNASILELACGPGNITHYLLEKRPDFKILATDMAPRMIELAKLNNPSAAVQLLDCRAMKSLGENFDAIMCGFCLPYLSKEESKQLISDAAAILRPNGILYLSTMEDDYSKSGLVSPSSGGAEQLYIYYHQANYLTEALLENQFSILEVRRQDFPREDGILTTDLLILAKKMQP